MKIGTILENLYAGYKTYLVVLGGTDRLGNVGCFSVSYVSGEWKFRKSKYRRDTLSDAEHFPRVGYIDIEELLVNGILGAVDGEK